MRNLAKPIAMLGGVFALAVAGYAVADVTLKASHQFPGGKGDPRDEMVQMIAREAQAADVGLKIRVYPGSSLFKPHDQWPAMVKGQLDITALPLDYASSFHPQFSATLMPGLPRSHEQAKMLNDSEYMQMLKGYIEEGGVKVLADAWLAGGFASDDNCILVPEDIAGDVTRAAGPYFERMLVEAGASIASMPSSEIYTAMQTGVLDSTSTSSGSLVSYRIYELSECVTAPGENTLWFMYEPVLISKRTWEKLTPEQQEVLMAAGQKAEDYFFEQAKQLDQELIDTFKKAGVEVVTMDEEQFDQWLEIAERTSYKHFRENVPGGDELLGKALEAVKKPETLEE
ncbi:MAG: TRAP transporter substrate-binding protein DctP [Candidatus Competibacteraceae bacterium]|nr:TRAP transporter substrate-binding protein DctP [Candidatus Competibacteraceae bacterium]